MDNLRRDAIRPAVAQQDWAGAAVAAANGLDGLGRASEPARAVAASPSSAGHSGGIGLLVVAAMMMGAAGGGANGTRPAVAAAKNIDPTDPAALASVPINALDDLSSRSSSTSTNAVRTSANGGARRRGSSVRRRPLSSPPRSTAPVRPSNKRSWSGRNWTTTFPSRLPTPESADQRWWCPRPGPKELDAQTASFTRCRTWCSTPQSASTLTNNW